MGRLRVRREAMRRLENVFSWSGSRAEKFRTCPRAYYFHYYGSWGGWERGAKAKVRELWLLKKLTSRYAWAGTAVHETIAWALEQASSTGTCPTCDEATSRMQSRMRKEFVESRDGAWRVRRALGLVEHAYEEAVSDDEWRDNWEHAQRCLENFFASRVREEILSIPSSRWMPIDSLDSFLLDGLKVYVAPDFAFRDEEDRLRILDWKTGVQKDADQKQVRGYVLFAIDKWRADPSQCTAELHYLRIPEVVRVDVTDSALEAFREEVAASALEMRSRLIDPEANVATAEAFEPAGNPRTCGRCNFRGLCDASEA